MRTLLLLCVFSFSAFAQETTESKIAAAEKAREEAVFKARVKLGRKKLPNEDFVKEYNEAWTKFGESQMAIYEDACKADPSKCLTPERKTLLQSQVRIETGLMTAKNNWAQQGKTEAEQKTAEENFKKCAGENKDCDKLPENDRRVADDSRRPANEEPKKDEPKKDEPVVNDDETVGFEITASLRQVQVELDALKADLLKKHPEWESKMDDAALENANTIEKAWLEKTLAAYKALCDKHPGKEAVCLDESRINALKDESAGRECLHFRKNAWFKTPADKRKEVPDSSVHHTQWKDLAAPKSCQTLLDMDKQQSEKPKERTDEENEDEKSPRNYDPDSCTWVKDLPRKIVQGPSCGKTPSKVCTGYVVCKQKNGQGSFVRMSSCRPQYCGEGDKAAKDCTKDMLYWSKKPDSEPKNFVSPKLKKILSGEVSEQ